MEPPVIYHNPRCGTSRSTLDLIRESGVEPAIVEYLKTPPSKESLRTLIAAAGLTPREAIRTNEPLYTELGLAAPDLTDDDLLDAIAANPVLLQRPFVVTAKGTRLARPITLVNEIL